MSGTINNSIVTTAHAAAATARATSDAWFGRAGRDFDEINDLVHKREILRQSKRFKEAEQGF